MFPGFVNVKLGNTETGDNPFVGMMKELRFWSEYRNQNIKRFMNLEIGSGQRANLLHYFRFATDTDVLWIRDTLSSAGVSDFTRINMKPFDSPLRLD